MEIVFWRERLILDYTLILLGTSKMRLHLCYFQIVIELNTPILERKMKQTYILLNTNIWIKLQPTSVGNYQYLGKLRFFNYIFIITSHNKNSFLSFKIVLFKFLLEISFAFIYKLSLERAPKSVNVNPSWQFLRTKINQLRLHCYFMFVENSISISLTWNTSSNHRIYSCSKYAIINYGIF